MPDFFSSIKQSIITKLEKGLDPRLGYHNVAHTLDVFEQSQVIAHNEGVKDEHDLLLLKIAAVFHDSGFLYVYKNHEEKSCEIATEYLKDTFNSNDLKRIHGMIMATKIPQTPHNLLEQIICDADLDYLGRSDFEPISKSLYTEFLSYNIIPADCIWDHLQIKFFEIHHYFTKSEIEKRNKEKLKHLAILKERSNWKNE